MPASFQQQNVLLVGAGAVGATIAAWLAPKLKNFYVLDQGETLKVIREQRHKFLPAAP